MKIACYSLVLGKGYTIPAVIDTLSRLGYDGVEWRVRDDFHLPLLNLGEKICEVKALCDQAGLALPALATYLSVGETEAIAGVLQAAAAIGVPAVRLLVPRFDGSQPYDRLLAETRRCLLELEPICRQTKVKAALELHLGYIIPSASAARRLLEGLSPDWVGAIYDPGNMVCEGMENWKKILQPELWRDAFSLPGKSGTEKLCLFLRAYLGKIRRLGANLPLFGKSEHFNKVLGELATKFVLEEADCPACGESDGVNAITLENGFGLRRCRKCGLLYTSPRWRKDQVLPDLRAAGNKAEKILLAHKRVSKIEQLKKPGKILDAACDDGEFLEVAHDSGYAACGVKSPGLLKTGAEDFHGTGFDVIVLFDALAHSDNPRAELAALGERLTPDGIVVLSLPNAGSEQASADIASWPLLMPWKNRGHYDYDSLEKLVDGCGFEIIDVDTELSSGVGEVGVFLVALRRKEFEPNGRIFLRADAARGDTLFATPIIKGLKEKYPGCKITVATHFPELLGYFDDLDFAITPFSPFTTRHRSLTCTSSSRL